ncbi:MAG: glycosyltransferase family 9 protein [Thalassobaculum sp.]|uniref:glycosyltransferase family 9 protein n=1 Tax=Thalassobaculum sp. TaxID=2022740 RepID=UPI0032EC2B9C
MSGGPAPESVLVYVGLDLVGDGLMKLPFVRALRNACPGARIVWLAGKGRSTYAGVLAPLVEGLIDTVVEEAGVGLGWDELRRPALAGTPLAGQRFDLVLDTQRRVKTTLLLRRIPHREFVSGAAGYWLSDRRPPRGHRRPPAMIRQMLDLLEAATGRPAVPTVTRVADPESAALADRLLAGRDRLVGFAPGAGGRQKCWPLDRYVELARRVAARGRTPVFLLGPDEADWAARIRDALPDAVLPLQDPAAGALAGSPLLTIAVAAHLDAAVANDSGGGHMLAAADIPLLSLFGPTPPAKFAPFVSRGAVVRAQDFGGGGMDAIPVDAVDAALETLLAAARHGHR